MGRNTMSESASAILFRCLEYVMKIWLQGKLGTWVPSPCKLVTLVHRAEQSGIEHTLEPNWHHNKNPEQAQATRGQ